jgi:alpha-L-fucosidase
VCRSRANRASASSRARNGGENTRFGLFITWGLFSIPADATYPNGKKAYPSLYLANQQMQIGEYAKLENQFDPTDFEAARWVKIAKDTGMKYIVIVAKFFDGFCMFDSRLTDFTVTKATPFKRDPIKELAVECRRHRALKCAITGSCRSTGISWCSYARE